MSEMATKTKSWTFVFFKSCILFFRFASQVLFASKYVPFGRSMYLLLSISQCKNIVSRSRTLSCAFTYASTLHANANAGFDAKANKQRSWHGFMFPWFFYGLVSSEKFLCEQIHDNAAINSLINPPEYSDLQCEKKLVSVHYCCFRGTQIMCSPYLMVPHGCSRYK
jgi:hypothetical protein